MFTLHDSAAKRKSLPNVTREAMLRAGLGKVALLLDALYFAGVRERQELRVAEILSVLDGWGPSRHLVRAALGDLRFFPVMKLEIKGRGRPSVVYRVPRVDEVREIMTSGMVSPSDPLEQSDFGSLAAYRAGLHREYIARMVAENGGEVQMSRRHQADRLGVTDRSVRRYDKMVGVQARAQYRRKVLTAEKLYIVPQKCVRDDSVMGHYWLEGVRADTGRVIKGRFVHWMAWKFLEICSTVEIVSRGANLYSMGALV